MAARRYARTEKGQAEIAQGRKNLRGKLRTVLFLVDPAKSGEAVAAQVSQIGAPVDAIEQLLAEGYITEVGAASVASVAQRPSNAPPAPASAVPAAGAHQPAAAAAAAGVDEVETFRVAKAFMNDTIVDALGIRAFVLTLRLERCATRADLQALIPDYTEALLKKMDRNVVRALVDRTRELIGLSR